MKFRKKPVVVDAMQLTADNVRDVQAWCSEVNPTDGPWADAIVQWHYPGDAGDRGREGWLVLTTAHGEEAIARPGDWVVPENQPGRFYPIKPDIFAATYEPAEDAA